MPRNCLIALQTRASPIINRLASMLRSSVAAALRHLARSRLAAAIAVCGLAIGIGVALLVALVIRNQYTFDHDVPGHERLYAIVGAFSPKGLAPQYMRLTGPDFAETLRSRSADIEASAVTYFARSRVTLGTRTALEPFLWADANLGRLLPMHSLAGDADAALASPDGLVLSLRAARRWFGEDAPLGRTLLVNDRMVTVRAVIADPHAESSHLERDFVLSSASSDSPQRRGGSPIKLSRDYLGTGTTYLRLRPGTRSQDLASYLSELILPQQGASAQTALELVRIDRVHTHEGLNPGFAQRMRLLALLGAVVFGIAAVNFVALQTARGSLRTREVAVRKLAGATPRMLAVQFLGEAIAWSMAASLLALGLTELLLPSVNAFLDTGARLNYVSDGAYVGIVLGVAVVLGALAGAWPAVVLSRVRPLAVLRGAPGPRQGRLGKTALVSLQFAVLIALAIGAAVVERQRDFAVRESLAVNGDQVVVVGTQNRSAFVEEVRQLPGVLAVTRAGLPLFGTAGFAGGRAIGVATQTDKDGNELAINAVDLDFDLFDFFGVRPLAGRLPGTGLAEPRTPPGYAVINMTALRRLGLGSPEEAIGKALPVSDPGTQGGPKLAEQTRVLAVVPDFTLDTIARPVSPTLYYPITDYSSVLFVRLDGGRVADTLEAIDLAWKKTGGIEPPQRSFLDQMLQTRYLNILRQSQAFGICALIAVLLACLGLYGLAESAAARRTREMALRKALGAQMRVIVRQLLWQFTLPVLWGTLIAWVAAGFLMQRWLEGFAYHAALPLWPFPAAAGLALLVAIATVIGRALAVGRTRPVVALRQE